LTKGKIAAMPLKVMTIVGTRPEIIKLSCVIRELDAHVEHVLVHTGQNYDYELNEIFFKELGVRKPDHFLAAAGKTAAATIGNVIAKSDALLEKVKPDAVLLYGDTNSCLAVISAKRRRIPIFHMEAGNRCFDQRVPEEINRKIVDHLSDINMPLTEHGRRNLLAEGIKADTVFKTGSAMKEVLQHYMPKITASTALRRLGVEEGKYFVVSAHREENVDDKANLKALLGTLNALAKKYKYKIIVSTHPRTRQRLAALDTKHLSPQIEFLKPLGFFDYVKLQMSAACVLSDSGTLTEESSILGFPGVMIRQAHERPEGVDEGTAIMGGIKADHVLHAVEVSMAHYKGAKRPFKLVADYETDNVSRKVLRIIMSYTDYVNRTVWFKN
jgi:UDP-N-acetylglucosamine 2-epimerase (non-hydrolysing)